MKKNYLFCAMATGMLLFTACSNDSDVMNVGEADATAQEIVLQVASSGDGLVTRAGRPLYGSNADQSIENVKVVIYAADNSSIKYANLISNWNTVSTGYTTNGHGKQYTLSLKGDDKLTTGAYKIVAVGYSEGTVYTFAPELTSLTKGATYSAISATTTAGEGEEVFAGEASLTIDANGKLTYTTGEAGAVVTLHRQVAGGFGYFQNIPAAVDGKKATTLRLVAVAKNTKVNFKDFNSSFTEQPNNVKYVVNGETPAATDVQFANGIGANVLYSINLKEWFTAGDSNNDGLLNGKDTWVHQGDVKTSIVKGSVFAGKFIIPFTKTANNTMELQLLAENDVILKSWTVSIPSADLNSDEKKGVTDTNASIFNVVRNHMYNLGVKTVHTSVDPTDPDTTDPDPTDPDPTDPTPDVNEPEDLSKGQNLILKVNDNWEAIHKLVID